MGFENSMYQGGIGGVNGATKAERRFNPAYIMLETRVIIVS